MQRSFEGATAQHWQTITHRIVMRPLISFSLVLRAAETVNDVGWSLDNHYHCPARYGIPDNGITNQYLYQPAALWHGRPLPFQWGGGKDGFPVDNRRTNSTSLSLTLVNNFESIPQTQSMRWMPCLALQEAGMKALVFFIGISVTGNSILRVTENVNEINNSKSTSNWWCPQFHGC